MGKVTGMMGSEDQRGKGQMDKAGGGKEGRRREKQGVCAGLSSSAHLIREETPTWPPLSL